MLSSHPTMTTISEPVADQTSTSIATTVPSGPTVFVGNLSFSTTAEQVTQLFGAEKVKSVRLIKKFGRFKGYGFVSFETQNDADQAVADWNGKESNGREIKVQPATEPKPVPIKSVKPVKPSSTESATAGPGAEGDAKKPVKKRKPRKPKKKVDEAAAPAAEESVSIDKKEVSEEKSKNKTRKPRRPKKTATDLSAPQSAPNQTPRKPRIPKSERELSKTSLFVGNLPYEVDDDDLKGLFSEFQVENARVVRYNERSKGYGFVYFADENNCSNAKTEFEGALLESRALIVKSAYKED